ncbi:electron transfer flavoprotein subunit beta/FixA family protein [Trueperella sp. LYQ143]|uniref:electron transfer flavoprotein subunit beta/FixA family protein n=1 Tax=unclassified Trueperella TaxID=2630174 RepID=UPI003983BA6A
MKIVAIYKWALNPDDALIKSDASVDWRNAKMVASDDDAAAIACAREILNPGDTLSGLTFDSGDASWALARGAEETYSITEPEITDDHAYLAQLLAAAITRMGDVDLVLIGENNDQAAVAGTIAGYLGIRAILGVESCTRNGESLTVKRRSGSNIEEITVALPALIGIAAASSEKNPPGMKEMLKARKRPITKINISDLNTDGTKRIEVTGTQLPENVSTTMFDGDPAEAAEKLIARLRNDGLL